MARLLGSAPVAVANPSAGPAPVERTPVLNPDITLPLGGERVTVREYSFFEAMDVVYTDRSFLDDCVVLLSDAAQDPWEAVRSLVGRHRGFIVGAIAMACDRPESWVLGLEPLEQDRLFSTWWAVDGHFFVQEAAVVLRSRRVASPLTGKPSSANSPLPVTREEASPDSAVAPSASSS